MAVEKMFWCRQCNHEVEHKEGKQQRGLKTIHFNLWRCCCTAKWRGSNWPDSWVQRIDIE